MAQIARSIARALNLNEDLAEAIALGHDLGHTPFGHIGEEVLNALAPGGFRHNEQSLRVVDFLEKDGAGLNLTWEVREGILKHSKGRYDFLGGPQDLPETLEGQACRLADLVAYVNHDISDALRAGVIVSSDLPQAAVKLLGDSPSRRIDSMVTDIIRSSWAAASPGGPAAAPPPITMSPPVLEAAHALREFLFRHVYDRSAAREEAEQARGVLRRLYAHLLEHPQLIPAEYPTPQDTPDRRVVDYIAGMTDRYALRLAQGLGL